MKLAGWQLWLTIRVHKPQCALRSTWVYSSRYSGEEGNDAANNAKLLRELSQIPAEDRSARFACSLVFIDEDGSETVAEGFIEGLLGMRRGVTGALGMILFFCPASFRELIPARWPRFLRAKRIKFHIAEMLCENLKKLSFQLVNVSAIISNRCVGTWRSLVARLLWEQDVAGSNPVVPTIFILQSYLTHSSAGVVQW